MILQYLHCQAQHYICDETLHTLLKITAKVQIPLEVDKQDEITSEIDFLGIVMDTVHQKLQLQKDKLERLLTIIAH